MKYSLLMLLIFAMFITGCANNEKQNTNQNNTNVKFDDPWMQRIWNMSIEVQEAYNKLKHRSIELSQAKDGEDLEKKKAQYDSAWKFAERKRNEFDALITRYIIERDRNK